MRFAQLSPLAVAILLAAAGAADAQDTTVTAPPAAAPARLAPIVAVARDVSRSPLELPFAVTLVRPDSARPGQRHLSADELLMLVPGITASSRNNPAQDPRVSIRGFGARSAFGVRSIRVMRDGMPLTLPDGQTPMDYLDLESVDAVEVMRGTSAALYGNAAGGVIDFRSAPPSSHVFGGEVRASAGTPRVGRVAVMTGGTSGPFAWSANVGHTDADNWREHAMQRLTNMYARGARTVGTTEIAVQMLGLDMPLAENPGALTAAQVNSDPTMADPASVTKRARKAVRQAQLGVSIRRPLGISGELTAQLYGGGRSLDNPLTFAVVGIDRRSAGAGARATWRSGVGGREQRVTTGFDAQWLGDDRRNWSNCNGATLVSAQCPALGAERGALRLDQREMVSSAGVYGRDEFALAGRARLSLGLRGDVLRYTLRDRYLSDGDDSGARTLGAISPTAGLLIPTSPSHSLYANVGTAFETPTTTELGNHADGSAGLNPDLAPQRSVTYEVGAKGVTGTRWSYDVAIYRANVRDELIAYEVPGGSGRTYYRNAGRTRRNGAEVTLGAAWTHVAVDAAYAYADFRFVEFLSGGVQMAGNRIPGTPEHQAQLAATWKGARMFATTEVIARSRVWANDANTARADGYRVVNLRLGGRAPLGATRLVPVIGVTNLFDARYIASLAINATGASLAATKFYEPGPGRLFFAGLTVGTR